MAHAELSAKDIETTQANNRTAVVLTFSEAEKEHLKQLVRIHDEFLKPIRDASL